MSFNLETISHNGVSITAWDVGGRGKDRPIFRHYYQNTDGLVFFVDCADNKKFDESVEELQRYQELDELRNVPILVLANKQDLAEAITPTEVEKRISEILTPVDRKWAVFGVSAVHDLSCLNMALDWLTSAIVDNEAKHVVSSWTPEILKDDDTTEGKDTKETLLSNDKGNNVCGMVESLKKLVWKFS